MSQLRASKVIEKHYSPRELGFLLGFDEKWWRQRAQEGEFAVRDEHGHTISQPVMLAGELRIPASGVNAYLARNPYLYDAGIAARNHAELRRKLGKGGRS
jgi:hypothetical protein